jgi:hypothetical protein
MIGGGGKPVQLDFEDVPAEAEGQLVLMPVSERYQERGIVFADSVRAVRIPPEHAAASLPSSGAVLLTPCAL